MTRQQRVSFFVYHARYSMHSALDWLRRGDKKSARSMRDRAWFLMGWARDEQRRIEAERMEDAT